MKAQSLEKVKSLSLYTSLMAHQAEAYLSFSSMKKLEVFCTPPGSNISPSQGSPKH